MIKAWENIAMNEMLAAEEVEDGVDKEHLQWEGVSGEGPDGSVFLTGEVYTREDYEQWIEQEGIENSLLPRELLSKQAALDHAEFLVIAPSVAPANFVATDDPLGPNGGTPRIRLNWTNPTSAPAEEGELSEWDVEIARCVGTTCTPTTIHMTVSLSGTNQQVFDADVIADTTYRYRARYRNETGAGPWSNINGATATGEDPI
jgi:hypothetical protein